MSRSDWQVSTAKAHFSELLQLAQGEPQVIQNRGRPVAVLLGFEEFQELNQARSRLAPAARMAEFLSLCRSLREEAGPELSLPERRDREVDFGAIPD